MLLQAECCPGAETSALWLLHHVLLPTKAWSARSFAAGTGSGRYRKQVSDAHIITRSRPPFPLGALEQRETHAAGRLVPPVLSFLPRNRLPISAQEQPACSMPCSGCELRGRWSAGKSQGPRSQPSTELPQFPGLLYASVFAFVGK